MSDYECPHTVSIVIHLIGTLQTVPSNAVVLIRSLFDRLAGGATHWVREVQSMEPLGVPGLECFVSFWWKIGIALEMRLKCDQTLTWTFEEMLINSDPSSDTRVPGLRGTRCIVVSIGAETNIEYSWDSVIGHLPRDTRLLAFECLGASLAHAQRQKHKGADAAFSAWVDALETEFGRNERGMDA